MTKNTRMRDSEIGKIVFVMGLPGVGKTTLLRKIEKDLTPEYDIRNFGEVMTEIGKEVGALKEKESILKVDENLLRKLQHDAILRFYKLSKERNIIIDTHSVIETSYGYLPGFSNVTLRKLKPNLIILIEADAAEILTRRKSESKERHIEMGLSEIEVHQQVSRLYAGIYSAMSGAYISILQNHDDETEKTVCRMRELLIPTNFRCY